MNAQGTDTTLETKESFDTEYRDPGLSAIDHFCEKQRELARLLPPDPSPILTSLVLLGIVSAVESYCREVIRRVILVDSVSRKKCEGKQLSFGAARVLGTELLPEALLEGVSIAGSSNIKETFRTFLDVDLNKSTRLKSAIEHFSVVVELRHCAVHRFGKLGTKNAIALGLDLHLSCIEKPLLLSYAGMQTVLEISFSLVCELNNYLYAKILERSNDNWSWDYRRDKKRFGQVFCLFYCSKEPPERALSPFEAYKLFRMYHV